MDIIFKEVEHIYMQGTPFEKVALTNFNLEIKSGSFTAVIGHTGSGKSTFIQHMNGLLMPTSGCVQVGPYKLQAGEKKPNLKQLRKEVGLVFQNPEHQLFEETVEKEICFGPVNFGMDRQVVMRNIKSLLEDVGLDDNILERSPLQLSGGQMRRVAIASILAQEPSVLILDEPAAGLDPIGRSQMMELFLRYHHANEMTTILVTHDMEEAAKYADQMIVLHEGTIEMVGSREHIFQQAERLQQIGLDLPEPVRFLKSFAKKANMTEAPMYFETEEVARYIASFLQQKGE